MAKILNHNWLSFIFSMLLKIRHLRQLKMGSFLHRFLTRKVLLKAGPEHDQGEDETKSGASWIKGHLDESLVGCVDDEAGPVLDVFRNLGPHSHHFAFFIGPYYKASFNDDTRLVIYRHGRFWEIGTENRFESIRFRYQFDSNWFDMKFENLEM